MFSFFFQYFFIIKFYVIHEEAHTNERFISCDLRWTSAVHLQGARRGVISRSRGRALYRDASRAVYMLGPPPARGGDRGVMCPYENMA